MSPDSFLIKVLLPTPFSPIIKWIPCENEIISSLLSVRKSIVRIGVLYERESAIEMFFGSGLLLTDELILTCAHNFDPIIWSTKKVPYSKIYICCKNIFS